MGDFICLNASSLLDDFAMFFKKHHKQFAVMEKFFSMPANSTQNVIPQPLERFLLLLQKTLLPLTVFCF